MLLKKKLPRKVTSGPKTKSRRLFSVSCDLRRCSVSNNENRCWRPERTTRVLCPSLQTGNLSKHSYRLPFHFAIRGAGKLWGPVNRIRFLWTLSSVLPCLQLQFHTCKTRTYCFSLKIYIHSRPLCLVFSIWRHSQ